MPFTISHAAAAWPVRRAAGWLPLDALVLGAMSPDFEYVLRLAIRGRFWHTPAGLVIACVPAVLAGCWLWRAIVRPSLVPLLPRGMRPASSASSSPLPATIAAAALAAWIGAQTHVFWDGFTHRTGWAVTRMPALETPALAIGIGRPWYNVLQHGSTLAGGVLLVAWIARWIVRHPPAARRWEPGQRRRLLRVAALLLGLALAAAVANGARALGSGPEWVLGYAAVGGMAGLALAAVGYGLAPRRR
jgi:Domain of unknown function (DUF4184)